MQITAFSSARVRHALLLAVGLSVVTPALAQDAALDAAAVNQTLSPIERALSGRSIALSLQASALGGQWRRFKPGASPEMDALMQMQGARGQMNVGSNEFVTRGDTLAAGGETYLIAYRRKADPKEMAAAMDRFRRHLPDDGSGPLKTDDGFTRMRSTDTLLLCLLNTRGMGDLNDIRAFDAKIDIASDAQIDQSDVAGANARSNSNLKQIGLGLLQYAQDYDEQLPPMRSAQSMAQIRQPYDASKLATVQQVLQPYLRSTELFAHPTTRQLYRPNLNLSGRSLAAINEPARTVAFYEAAPAPDGTRAVLYLDGHVKREQENNWARIRAVSAQFAPPINFKKGAKNVASARGMVTLYGASAVAYMVRRKRDARGQALSQPIYISKSVGRAYYRNPETKQAIWLDAPAQGITIPANQGAGLREFKGYNGQNSGRNFGGYGARNKLSA